MLVFVPMSGHFALQHVELLLMMMRFRVCLGFYVRLSGFRVFRVSALGVRSGSGSRFVAPPSKSRLQTWKTRSPCDTEPHPRVETLKTGRPYTIPT